MAEERIDKPSGRDYNNPIQSMDFQGFGREENGMRGRILSPAFQHQEAEFRLF